MTGTFGAGRLGMARANKTVDGCSARRGCASGGRAIAAAVALACVTIVQAQIRTDGSLGPPATALTGPNYVITEALGRLAGSNLFHSFQVFNVGGAESATFVTTTPDLSNVISRVTGGSASQIDGGLRLASANAAPNFIFINPAGVVFGQAARIDVPAAFHVATADYVRFPDGNFYADPQAVSTLSSAAPEAFGFLGTTRATIEIRDGAVLQTTSPRADQPISVVAGDIAIDSGRVQTAGGEIRMVAVGAGAQDVSLSGPLPDAYGELRIANGGLLLSMPSGDFDAGGVAVSAGDVLIDGRARPTAFTGLATQAVPGTGGDAGDLTVSATGALAIFGRAGIRSETQSSGQAGTIRVRADTLALGSGGAIESNTAASGDAGTVTVSAGDIVVDSRGSTFGASRISSVNRPGSSGDAGAVQVTAAGSLLLLSGGEILSNTVSSGRAGTVTVNAGDLSIDSRGDADFTTGIASVAGGGTGDAGDVHVNVGGTLSLVDAGQIRSDTFGSGDAGAISVRAGTLSVGFAGAADFTGITSSAFDGTGNAGSIDVAVDGTLSIANGGVIGSSTFTSGNAGVVSVAADTLSLARGGVIDTSTFGSGNGGGVMVKAGTVVIDAKGGPAFTGITSATYGGPGSAGNIEVAVDGTLSIVSGGIIDSSTYTSGHAGAVLVTALDIAIDGTASAGFFTGISSQAGDTGNAGRIDVTASGAVSIIGGGAISAGTFASGNAGAVTVKAASLTLDANGVPAFTGIASGAYGGTGNAGNVDVVVDTTLSIVGGGSIDSSTYTSGHAGALTVAAGDIAIDGYGGSRGFTGITSQATPGSTGNAGNVEVKAGRTLSIIGRGTVSSDTFGAGRAGSVQVGADSISADDNGLIGAAASAGSSGQTGTVSIAAREGITLANGASFSIQNDATVADPGGLTPTLLTVSAPAITLANGGEITAASSGNVAASNIVVNFGPQLAASNARISTSAQDGNGGSIAVAGSGDLLLQNTQITTSVAGLQGDGGDIGIQALNLVMETGFIQANTAAANASGGDVNIQVGGLLPSGSTLFVGGATPYRYAPGVFGFNVIQAAAPTGVSGTVSISTPALDIVGSITALAAGFLDEDALAQSRCAIVGGSSLARTGRGGLPPAAGDLLWIDPPRENATPPVPGLPFSGRWRFPLGAGCGALGG